MTKSAYWRGVRKNYQDWKGRVRQSWDEVKAAWNAR